MKRPSLLLVGIAPVVAMACTSIAGLVPVPTPVDNGDATMEAGDDGGSGCMTGQTECTASNSVVACGTNGTWATDAAMACVNMTCLDGGCAGVCAPGETQCNDEDGGPSDSVEICGPDGQWGPPTPCATKTCSGGACSGSTTSGKSCAGKSGGPGLTTCGPGLSVNCCTSYEVAGGSFLRGYDGVSSQFSSKNWPATVAGLRIDAYEVTVGRFRQFVAATLAGFQPMTGSGKHDHLLSVNGQTGLADCAGTTCTGFENGWLQSWTDMGLVPSTTGGLDGGTPSGWEANLTNGQLCGGFQTWTPKPVSTASETNAINCVSWYEAYAFCIWDDGFLPSLAEWNYTAAGGSQQRSTPGPPTTTPPTSTVATPTSRTPAPPGAGCRQAPRWAAESPKGDGLWNQSDLAGNMSEWVIDAAPLESPLPEPPRRMRQLRRRERQRQRQAALRARRVLQPLSLDAAGLDAPRAVRRLEEQHDRVPVRQGALSSLCVSARPEKRAP